MKFVEVDDLSKQTLPSDSLYEIIRTLDPPCAEIVLFKPMLAPSVSSKFINPRPHYEIIWSMVICKLTSHATHPEEADLLETIKEQYYRHFFIVKPKFLCYSDFSGPLSKVSGLLHNSTSFFFFFGKIFFFSIFFSRFKHRAKNLTAPPEGKSDVWQTKTASNALWKVNFHASFFYLTKWMWFFLLF